MKSKQVRSPAVPRRALLPLAVLVACGSLSQQALAGCGPATPDGQIVCAPADEPVSGVRYTGVENVELLLKSGLVVDGRLGGYGDTAVVLYGKGALTLTAEDGTIIRGYDGWPAVDVVSSDGPVTVRVDQVYGGHVGVAAAAAGDVFVWANYVDGNTAIDAYSLGGNVTVDVAAAMAGAYGAGVSAVTEKGNVTVLAGEVLAQGDGSTGVYASTKNGGVSIEAGWLRAEGAGAVAVLAESWQNGDVVVDVHTASSSGEQGAAIFAAAGVGDIYIKSNWASAMGPYGVGIGAFAFEGDVRIDAVGIGTDGDYTRGIDVGALGAVDVTLESAFTTGANAEAVNIETVGNVSVGAQRLTTYGMDAYALRVLTSKDVAIDVDEITTFGERSSALFASSNTGDVVARVGKVHTWASTGDWFAIGLASASGDVALLVEEEVRAESGYAVTTGSLFGGATIGVAEGATVFGQTAAIDSMTALGTRIDIAGTVESGTGPAIAVRGNDFGAGAADIRIRSTGAVRGHVALEGGDDIVANVGDYNTDGHNTFGAGNDRFTNAGRVTLRNDATTIAFTGLERFENMGRVSLDNGRTGDVFAVDGTLHGAGGTLAIDLDLGTGDADHIQAGALSGTNALSLDLMGRGSLLGLKDIRVVTTNQSQTGDELVLAADSRNRGFVGFRLAYDGLDSWLLESDLTDQAYLAAAVPAGVRDLWRQGAQTLSTHLTATHDGQDTDGVWFQLVGGDFQGSSHFTHARGGRDLDWDGNYEGAQLGAEMTIGIWRAGITGGYGKASMDLGGAEETKLDSINAGLYARYANAGWFVDALLRGDRIDMDTSWRSIGLEDSGDGSTIGVWVEGGHRFSLSRMWIEPLVRMSWIDVDLPDQVGRNGSVHWEGGATGTGELGLRLGVNDGWKSVRPYAAMSIAREFGGGDATDYDIGFETVRVTEEGERTFGRFAGGAEWSIGRVDLYGEIEQRLGDMEGLGGRIGARVRF